MYVCLASTMSELPVDHIKWWTISMLNKDSSKFGEQNCFAPIRYVTIFFIVNTRLEVVTPCLLEAYWMATHPMRNLLYIIHHAPMIINLWSVCSSSHPIQYHWILDGLPYRKYYIHVVVL